MRDMEEFDALYASARQRLLLQTYAVAGDVSVAQSAVRSAFVLGWHHWRKVARSADPEAWVRETAWRHPRVRSHLNWRRDRSPDPEIAATLAALHGLSADRRRQLVLHQLTDLPTDDGSAIAAEYAAARDVTVERIGATLHSLEADTATVQWPRVTIIRRDGGTRRRLHTVVGVVAAAAVTLGAGLLVTTPEGARPSLVADEVGSELNPPDAPSLTELIPGSDPEQEPEQLTVGRMLTKSQLGRLAPSRTWRTVSTTDNTDGDGLVLPCQQRRFADEEGRGALLRSFNSRPAKRQPDLMAWQFTELSATPRRAERALEEVRNWYAGCAAERMQLIQTRSVAGVGNGATLFLLRSWQAPVTTYAVGVARSGSVITTTVSARTDATAPNMDTQTQWLAAAVNALCGSPGTAACAAPPASKTVDPLPAGPVSGMLSEIDMPPVSGVQRPWVGTEPRAALQNFASTQCDQTSFTKNAGVTNALTRTFVIPEATLPDEFGLTQSVGTMPRARAAQFFNQIRNRVLSCGGEDKGTEVESLRSTRSGARELLVWRLLIEVSDSETVPYLMGVAREGAAVTQIGFYPSGTKTMGSGAFVSLVERAQRRLRHLPKPDAGSSEEQGSDG